MQIGILGGGRVGGALAQSWRNAGHDVGISTRETVAETAAGADVLLLAVPRTAAADVLAAAGDISGKVLIDATNNLSGGPGGAEIASMARGAHTVKAFNTVFAQFFAEPPATRPTLVFAGDDPAAKEIVAGLIRDAGFEPVDAGDHSQAADLEAFARLVIGIAYRQGRGPFTYRFEIA
jgi:predicted dinucleotide-binding enzyme